MKSNSVRNRAASDALPRAGRASVARLLWEYTLLFALFFAAVYSPFWVYGKALIWGSDGMSQQLPALLYGREWLAAALEGLRLGRLELPFWDLCIGFGQNTMGTNIVYRLADLAFALFPDGALEPYMAVRTVLSVYLAGLCFLAYGRTRVKDRQGLLLGSLLYAFSGVTLFFRHFFFFEMIIALPLILLAVDRIFEGRWSWLFVAVVAVEGLHSFYTLFMLTVPAVIYALFHFFELSAGERAERGGFARILLRHAVQYAAGLGLAAVSLLPILIYAFGSSRTSAQQGVSLLHWNARTYLDFIRAIVDMETIGSQGHIAMTGIALAGVCGLFCAHRRRERWLWGQLLLYTAVFLVPALAMVFSGFAGKSQRWCYIYSFWTALAAACALPRLREADGRSRRICLYAVLGYVALYLVVAVWSDREISVCLVAAMLSAALLLTAVLSNWGRRRQRRAAILLFALALAELTVKSYSLYAPQYQDAIAGYYDAGKVLAVASDNAADALEMAADGGLFRTDVISASRADRQTQANYGVRNHVNGVSSYYSFTERGIIDYSLDLGNAQQASSFKILDLDQRTVLDELAGVKYAAALEEGVARIPYGYEPVGSREKTLSDGSTRTESLYRNRYALPLSYAYDAWISREDYLALPVNRREQAMLQGVVLEEEAPLKRAELTFDDRVLLDGDAVMSALEKAARKNDKLEIAGDGAILVRGANCSVTLPIEETTGEIGLLLEGVRYRAVNFGDEAARELSEAGAPRLDVMNARRRSRAWVPNEKAGITAVCGELSGGTVVLGTDAQYYFGQRDLLINLGYGSTDSKLKLTFSAVGEYRFDRIAVIAQPMEAYGEKVEPLQTRAATSVEIDGNRVTVRYDLSADALACLAIPYSEAWSATVDGEAARILPANGMYMGVLLPEGSHTVVFRYILRGFREGLAISLLTLIALVAFAIVRGKRRGRGRIAGTGCPSGATKGLEKGEEGR